MQTLQTFESRERSINCFLGFILLTNNAEYKTKENFKLILIMMMMVVKLSGEK